MATHWKLGMFVSSVFMAIGSVPAHAVPPLPGAVFTSKAGCLSVDDNIYALKADVYLNGGPSRPGAAGLLPNTYYYVQVTDPSGATLLGTSLQNSNGDWKPVLTNNLGNFSECYQLASIVTKPNQHPATAERGYNDTPNRGNEYKVWISTAANFDNDNTKTDNFKVAERSAPPPPPSQYGNIVVKKFYDRNLDGNWNDGEPVESEILGWKVDLSVFPPQNTLAKYLDIPFDSYTGREYFPIEIGLSKTITYNPWFATNAYVDTFAKNGIQGASSAKGIMNTIPVDLKEGKSDRTVYFGNVCTGKGGGLTLGYWSNQNGKRDMENYGYGGMDALLAGLSALNLKDWNGSDFNPPSKGYNAFRTWLLQGNATNMAYMLSVQLSAMWLNVKTGKVNGGQYVYAEGVYVENQSTDSGFITIDALITAANNSLENLAESGNYTRPGVPLRTYQEYLKNALDLANNDKTFVQSKPCSFSFNNPVLPTAP